MPRKLLYGISAIVLLVSVFLVSYYLLQKFNQTPEGLKAAIVDQLSIEQDFANTTFVDSVTSILTSAGYNVETFSGQEVDVRFYESLSSRGFGVVVLRAHSAVRQGSEYVDLFTSERYVEGKYAELGDQISKATFFFSPKTTYFAVGPTFVSQSMKGNFADTVIILMGCSSLNYTTMAETFVGKGASVVVGWTGLVLPSETDYHISLLLQYLFDQSRQYTIKEAVDKINQQLGLRPTLYGSLLRYFPNWERDYIVPIRKMNLLMDRVYLMCVFQQSTPRSKQDFLIQVHASQQESESH